MVMENSCHSHYSQLVLTVTLQNPKHSLVDGMHDLNDPCSQVCFLTSVFFPLLCYLEWHTFGVYNDSKGPKVS